MKSFTDNNNGTITDNQTGLMWLKNANEAGAMTWKNANEAGAMTWKNAMLWTKHLTYGQHSDWRLPTRFELESLLDYSQFNPALPQGHPFINVQSSYYWSSSTCAGHTLYAWYVYMFYGNVNYNGKSNVYYVWPVRGGKS